MAKQAKAAVAEKREKWAAQAKVEREARRAPGAKRLDWLQRPGIKARLAPETWKAEVAACKAVLAKRAGGAR